MTTRTKVFMGLFIAMALSASALILTIPALLGPFAQHQFWLTVTLGIVTAILGAAAAVLRPPKTTHNTTT